MARVFTWTVVVYDTKNDFPATGDVNVIYIDASTNKPYRYDDSYYPISSAEVNLWGALGSVSKGGGGGGGASWGDITGMLSSQTDLQTALDAKQDDLVSGTSIKTINSTSLLGSGNVSVQDPITLTTTGTSGAATLVGSTLNIPQYSGGGASGVHNLLKPISGRRISYALGASATGSNFTVSRLTLVPFFPANTLTISEILMYCNILGTGSLCRLLIYSDNNGVPNAKLYESANLDLSTTGFKIATTTFTFNAGTTYWLGFHGGSVTANVTCHNISVVYPIANSGGTPNAVNGYNVAVALGSAPANITIGSATFNTAAPQWIGLTPA